MLTAISNLLITTKANDIQNFFKRFEPYRCKSRMNFRLLLKQSDVPEETKSSSSISQNETLDILLDMPITEILERWVLHICRKVMIQIKDYIEKLKQDYRELDFQEHRNNLEKYTVKFKRFVDILQRYIDKV